MSPCTRMRTLQDLKFGSTELPANAHSVVMNANVAGWADHSTLQMKHSPLWEATALCFCYTAQYFRNSLGCQGASRPTQLLLRGHRHSD